jgi:hypothetical protein
MAGMARTIHRTELGRLNHKQNMRSMTLKTFLFTSSELDDPLRQLPTLKERSIAVPSNPHEDNSITLRARLISTSTVTLGWDEITTVLTTTDLALIKPINQSVPSSLSTRHSHLGEKIEKVQAAFMTARSTALPLIKDLAVLLFVCSATLGSAILAMVRKELVFNRFEG